MHPAAYEFVRSVVADHDMQGLRILDLGSRDVNGSVRDLFSSSTLYHGIDIAAGPGVDEVVACADYAPTVLFDTCVSTEVMEHMQDPSELTSCAWRCLRAGGMLILTAAGPNRQPHSVSGGAVGEEYYENISPELLALLLEDWRSVRIIYNAIACDIYATAVKP
jgi:SAM-dependent methyltransferase